MDETGEGLMEATGVELLGCACLGACGWGVGVDAGAGLAESWGFFGGGAETLGSDEGEGAAAAGLESVFGASLFGASLFGASLFGASLFGASPANKNIKNRFCLPKYNF